MKLTKRNLSITGVILLLAVLAVIFVFRQSDLEKKPIETVALQLPWTHSASYAGFYLADHDGYYLENGLDLKIIEGGPKVNPSQSLQEGKSQFSLLIGAEVVRQRDQGIPLKAVACIYRRSPLVYISKTSSNIKHPRDFKGKVIRGSKQNVVVINAMISKFGLKPDDVTIVPSRNYADFYSDKINIWGGYSAVSLEKIRTDGHEVNVINPDNYGVHFYYSCIVTTDQVIAEKPDMITSFLSTTILKGWPMAFSDPNHAAEIVSFYMADNTFQAAPQIAMMLPLVDTGKGDIGWMDREVWEYMIKTLTEQGLLQNTLQAEDVYTPVFLEKIFSQQG